MATPHKLFVQVAEIIGLKGDIFVELRLKNHSNFIRTSPVKSHHNPVVGWSQVFEFTEFSHKDVLTLKVYHDGTLGNKLLGALEVPLSSLPASNTRYDGVWDLMEDTLCKHPGCGKAHLVIDFVQPNKPTTVASPSPIAHTTTTTTTTVVLPQQHQAPLHGPSNVNVSVVDIKSMLAGHFFVELRVKNSTHFVRTHHIKGSNHVAFNEHFQLHSDHVETDLLVAKLYDKGTLHDHLLGMIEIPLGLVVKNASVGVPVTDSWFELFEDANKHRLRGSIHLAISLGPVQQKVVPIVQQPLILQPPVSQPAYPSQGVPIAPPGAYYQPPQQQQVMMAPPPQYYSAPPLVQTANPNVPPVSPQPLQHANSQGQLQPQQPVPPFGAVPAEVPHGYQPIYPQLYPQMAPSAPSFPPQ